MLKVFLIWESGAFTARGGCRDNTEQESVLPGNLSEHGCVLSCSRSLCTAAHSRVPRFGFSVLLSTIFGFYLPKCVISCFISHLQTISRDRRFQCLDTHSSSILCSTTAITLSANLRRGAVVLLVLRVGGDTRKYDGEWDMCVM